VHVADGQGAQEGFSRDLKATLSSRPRGPDISVDTVQQAGISKIRDIFIRRLSENLEPVKLVQLGIELRVYSLLLNGYAGLVVQIDGISTEDEALLGMKVTSKLFRIRDKYLQKYQDCDFGYGDKRIVMSEVKRLFPEELKETIQK
jgi:hypothetical protein